MESALEWLRPLVDSKNWEYCVVWKLGDDPSRFIEWVGCCCYGANGVDANVKKENGGKQKFTALCRDSQVQHPIRTKACEALTHFPLSISLYSGIQGEVVTSNEPKWINHAEISNSNLSQELKGTLVLIPVAGGLVELYNSKLIYKDQKKIDFVTNKFKLGLEEANSSIAKKEDKVLDSFPYENLSFYAPPLQYTTSFPTSAPHISHVSESSANPSIQGSSTGSIPSDELTSDHLSRNVPLSQFTKGYFEHTELQCSGNLSRMEGTATLPWKQENYIIAGDVFAMGKKRQKGPYQSKNLVTERKRRNRIKDGLFALRSLVPNISKMDKVAILGDAIDYISELQEKVKLYQAELNKIEAEVSNNEPAEVVLSDMSKMYKVTGPTNENTQISVNATKRTRMEGQVEVNQIGSREFMLKVSGSYKPGGFTQLIEAMNYLGLEVVNVSFTTSGREILSIFIAEANMDRVLDTQKLRSSLIELTS